MPGELMHASRYHRNVQKLIWFLSNAHSKMNFKQWLRNRAGKVKINTPHRDQFCLKTDSFEQPLQSLLNASISNMPTIRIFAYKKRSVSYILEHF